MTDDMSTAGRLMVNINISFVGYKPVFNGNCTSFRHFYTSYTFYTAASNNYVKEQIITLIFIPLFYSNDRYNDIKKIPKFIKIVPK